MFGLHCKRLAETYEGKEQNVCIISQIFFNQIVANTELTSKQLRVHACVRAGQQNAIYSV